MRIGVPFTDFTTVAANLQEVRPHFIVSVPRVYEKVYDKVETGPEYELVRYSKGSAADHSSRCFSSLSY